MTERSSSDLELKPWMRGPYELFRHADGHLEEAGDTDRRIALIGFDNAIEVAIDVFIRLHPRLRDNLTITRERKEQALQNYHSKIEFLDTHVQEKSIALDVPVDEIVWFHQLRNELYHSGNGMVPEMHVLRGARSACLAVFQALFRIDPASFPGSSPSQKTPHRGSALIRTDDEQMEFLRWFIELEQLVVELALKQAQRGSALVAAQPARPKDAAIPRRRARRPLSSFYHRSCRFSV